MTSEVSTVGPPHTLLQVNGSFVNDASDKTEPPLPSDVVIQRRSQLGVPSLCQLDISSPMRYGVPIGNMIWMPAAWLHLLQWMLPLTQGTEAHWNEAGSARLDERQWLLTTQGLSCCSEMRTHPQPSPEPGAHLCTSSIPLPLTSCMVHRAEAHGVGRSPPPTLAIRRQERYRHLNSNSLKISTSKGDTSRTSFGATLHHKNKTADHGPIPVENLESLAFSFPW